MRHTQDACASHFMSRLSLNGLRCRWYCSLLCSGLERQDQTSDELDRSPDTDSMEQLFLCHSGCGSPRTMCISLLNNVMRDLYRYEKNQCLRYSPFFGNNKMGVDSVYNVFPKHGGPNSGSITKCRQIFWYLLLETKKGVN